MHQKRKNCKFTIDFIIFLKLEVYATLLYQYNYFKNLSFTIISLKYKFIMSVNFNDFKIYQNVYTCKKL